MHRVGSSFVQLPDQPSLALQSPGRPSTSGAPCSVHWSRYGSPAGRDKASADGKCAICAEISPARVAPAYSELMSITIRAGLSSRETRNGRFSSTPTAQVRTASKPAGADELDDGGRRWREARRPGVRPRRRLLGQVGVERGLHPDDEHGAACDSDLLPGAVGQDRRRRRTRTSYPGTPFSNSKTTRS